MKKQFTHKTISALLALFSLLLLPGLGWGQQVIGSFPYMNGGFEGQTTGALGTTLSATAWTRQSQSGASSSIITTTPRSGAQYATATGVATASRNLQSPQGTTGGPAANTSYVVQFFVKNAAAVNGFQGGITLNGTTNPVYSTAATLAINTVWTKQAYILTTGNFTVATNGIVIPGRSQAGSFDVDDVVVYAGTEADVTAPNSPGTVTVSNVTTSSLDVSWEAATGGVDGGGYVVVRYALSPNADNDPNQNGIYAIGNTTTNGTGALTGTVVYIGTGSSFTNSGLTAGTSYWYKVYTVDKAFNYSIESIGAGTTSNGSPTIASPNPSSLSGFSAIFGTASAAQSFTISGTDLTADLVVAAPTNFEVRESGVGSFGSSVSFTPSSGTVATKTIEVRIAATADMGAVSGNVACTSTGATTQNVAVSGTVYGQIDWCNLQWPAGGTIDLGSTFNVYAQVYEPGITPGAGQGAGITAWIGYSTENTDPSTWTNWVAASYLGDVGNNDEYVANLGAAITPAGSYYYASRFQLGSSPFYVYGGFNGGFWNGTSNVSGTLTINPPNQIDWANLQSPASGNITSGDAFNVYAQVYEAGLTPGAGQGAGISVWIGYSTSNTNPNTWTNWVAATFNTDVGNNDEYMANLGPSLTGGTYYYASRFKFNLADYVYGGYSIEGGGFWNGTTYVSGVVNVMAAEPVNHVTGFGASTASSTSINVNWTNSDAMGYLVKGSSDSYSAIVDPVDGVAESNGALVRNVTTGETWQFTGLTSGTPYYFKIFPYNGTGTAINYKTGGSVPQATATTLAVPTLIEILLPQYIQGNTATNTTRVPYAYRVRLNNLLPNATYRYFNQVVISSDDVTSNGAGNVIFVNLSGSFTRSTGPSLATAGNYSEFTTDGSGSYTGWFVTEPTGNVRFTPGNQAYLRIMLNNGAGGTTVTTRLTTANFATVINFGTSGTATLGTGIYGTSYSSAKDFVFLYDNTGGSGRPLAGTMIETDGTDNTTANSYVAFYGNNVNSIDKSWGTIIPNVNANGVKRLEYRKLGNGDLIYHTTDEDGNWGGVNTISPLGGTTALVMPQNSMDDLTIYSGTSIQVPTNGNLTVSGTLTNNSGNTGLIIKSDASGTGSLLHNTDNVPATIERYITGLKYHFVSVPLTQASNPTAALFMNSYLLRWNSAGPAWVWYTAPGDALSVNQGYLIQYTHPSLNVTYNFAGAMNNGSFTAATPAPDGGFSLVPNPYPSAINWDAAAGWTKTNIANAVYVYNNNQYASYVGGVGVNGGSNFIPVGQAFFVKSDGGTGTLTMNNSVRVHDNQAFYKNHVVDNVLRISTTANGKSDETAIRLLSEATAAFDAAFDANKMLGANDAPQLYSIAGDNQMLSINTLPLLPQGTVVPLAFKYSVAGTITLQFNGLESLTTTAEIFLEDVLTGSMTNLRQQANYSFTHSVSNQPERFKLHIGIVTNLDDLQSKYRIWTYDRKIYIDIPAHRGEKVLVEQMDLLGKSLQKQSVVLSGPTIVPARAAGVALIKVTTADRVYTAKLFIQ